MEKKVISCEISFIPIQSENYLMDIETVLGIIRESNLPFETNVFSTIITSTKREVFEVLEKIFSTMEKETKFVIVAKLSNVCGCDLA